MKPLNHFAKLICLLFVLCLTQVVAAQEVPTPPAPPPMPEGSTWVNPKPGIVAPGKQKNGARTVTASRGYGDVSLSYFLNYVTAHGQTWLNNTVTNPHYICARVITIDDNGRPRGGNENPSCTTTSQGGSISNSSGGHAVACGHYVATRTYHSIYRSGKYDWGAEDFDAFYFCS